MSNPADDGYAHAVIETVRDMQRVVEEHTRAGNESRLQLQKTVEGLVAAMRTDVHKAITSLELGQVDHKAGHEADRIERTNRQIAVDVQMAQLRNWVIAALVGIVAIGFFLIGWLVF